MKFFLFPLVLLYAVHGKVPREYEEVDESENMLFTVKWPSQLAYTFQMKHAYMLGSHFAKEPNTTMRNVQLVLADPPQACSILRNSFIVPTAVLIERGGCSFTEKANFATESGAALVMVTDTDITTDLEDWNNRRDYVNMIPDSSLRIVNVPCVYITSVTGKYFREYLMAGEHIQMDIPVPKITTRWTQHQRNAPWEYWDDDLWFI